MARTQITETWVARDTLVATSGIEQQADATNGMYVSGSSTAISGQINTRKSNTLLLRVKNTTAAAVNCILRAGSGADVGPAWRAPLGDNTLSIPAQTEQTFKVADTARYHQADGSTNVDFGAYTPVAEVQTVTVTGVPTGGTFTLSFLGQTTAATAYNATAATVQTNLQALSTIGTGNATVAGSAGGPFTVTFAGALANLGRQAMLTGNGALLTGGTSPAVSVAEATAGASITVVALREAGF